jgi:hypothetical protein
MTSNYQQGRDAVKDAKEKSEHVSDKTRENLQGAKEKAQGAWDKTKEYAKSDTNKAGQQEGIWDKTKEVASDVKDSISQTASNVYEKAKDMVSPSDTSQKSTYTETKTETKYNK